MKTIYYDIFPFLGGQLFIAADEVGLVFTSTDPNAEAKFREMFGDDYSLFQHGPRMTEYRTRFQDYEAGRLTSFDFQVHYLNGTPLQQKVWRKLEKIPYGKTMSYQKLASQMRMPKSVRSIATAVGKNPVLIVAACHRIIQNNGLLGDYREGVEAKLKLLELEGVDPLPPITKAKPKSKGKKDDKTDIEKNAPSEIKVEDSDLVSPVIPKTVGDAIDDLTQNSPESLEENLIEFEVTKEKPKTKKTKKSGKRSNAD